MLKSWHNRIRLIFSIADIQNAQESEFEDAEEGEACADGVQDEDAGEVEEGVGFEACVSVRGKVLFSALEDKERVGIETYWNPISVWCRLYPIEVRDDSEVPKHPNSTTFPF